jgi:hypothetical protein
LAASEYSIVTEGKPAKVPIKSIARVNKLQQSLYSSAFGELHVSPWDDARPDGVSRATMLHDGEHHL